MKPTTMEVQELKHLVASRLDVTELLDILGITMFELVDILESSIEENFEELLEAVE